MKYGYKEINKEAEEKIEEMKKTMKCEEFKECDIRKLVSDQNGELSTRSRYYKGNIAEGNWNLIEEPDIENLDKEIIDGKTIDAEDVLLGRDEYPRKKDAEFSYVFMPSYYAVKTLILYYLIDKKDAEKIYGLKNAVVRRDVDKFYGGLPFILRYIEKLPKDDPIRFDFAEIMEKLIESKSGLEANKEKDNFINDIIDCIRKSRCKDLILEKRIKDFKEAKAEYFCINFKEEIEKQGNVLNYIMIDDYKILMHRDVKKDWNHLKKEKIKEVNEKIRKTPKHPNNDSIKDSEELKANLKGWFSQEVGKKDRLVYRKEVKEKTVYIATVCDHYKEAARRTKSRVAYR